MDACVGGSLPLSQPPPPPPVTHEVAHALGFSSVFFENAGIVMNVTNLRGKPFAAPVINSSTVVAKAREQYGCPTLEYLEVEDQGGSGSAGSHLKGRNAKDELMAPASAAGYYTNLTMAVFEDLGFYKADFSMAEVMPWGRNASCDFLTKKCMEDNITQWPEMFCNTTDENALRSSTPPPLPALPLSSLTALPHPPSHTWHAPTASESANALYAPIAPRCRRTSSTSPTSFQVPDGRFTCLPSLGGLSAFLDYCPFIVGYSNGACNQDPSRAPHALAQSAFFSENAAAVCAFEGDQRLLRRGALLGWGLPADDHPRGRDVRRHVREREVRHGGAHVQRPGARQQRLRRMHAGREC
ncbi:GP63 (plasmid) [Leishmania braziliensis MHOM/BR/75/M2904]|uniref:Leishmanolysin n=1 Tax=Leishmania braziliensis MHOM/BR/75/M2904 TaxID=420245 RepID=A0A3P3YZZ4_LEIBR|nr:GP63 [Leishmania braziliensis MHOM/BR/75/M2904]